MKITINNEPIEIGATVTSLRALIDSRNIREAGLAIALNGRLVVKSKWSSTLLKENDEIVIITAAFGG